MARRTARRAATPGSLRLFILSGARRVYARPRGASWTLAPADRIDGSADSLLQKISILAVLLTMIPSGCAAYRRYEASKPENIRKTEAMLSDAGFTTIKLDTDDKVGLVEDLPPDEIRSYAARSGTVYWYYDPDLCECVYEGHQGEFDRYQMAREHEYDTAEYAAESDDEQVASLNALNATFFPVPIFWIGGFAPSPHFIGGGHSGGHGGGHGVGHGHGSGHGGGGHGFAGGHGGGHGH